jgi:hypothetical protein
LGSAGVIDGEFLSEVLAFAFDAGAAAVDLHCCGSGGNAGDVGVAGDGAVFVLVEKVGGVGRFAEVCAGGIATAFGGGAVADFVVGEFELLAGDVGAVGPFAFAAGDLAEVVVGIGPA